MTVKERLHELIDSLDEAEAEALLAFASRDAEQYPPLTPQQVHEIQRRIDQHVPADVISNEEVFARFGFTELAPAMRPLTEAETERIRSALAEDASTALSTEQLLESLGIAD